MLVALTYLGTQCSMVRIGELFNLAPSTVYSSVHDCITYINLLTHKYIKWPSKEESPRIAEKFEAVANFPNVIGAIDGTHITVKAPSDQQDSYTNRKCGKSIIMQGICTSEKVLTNLCVGFPGSAHDTRILANSKLNRLIESSGSETLFYEKYHLVGDSAYPLKDWLMTPFRDSGNLSRQKKKFNIALSRTRCVIENYFGLLKGRWRRLLHIDVNDISFAPIMVQACCVLQNFCLRNAHFCENIVVLENSDLDVSDHDHIRASAS